MTLPQNNVVKALFVGFVLVIEVLLVQYVLMMLVPISHPTLLNDCFYPRVRHDSCTAIHIVKSVSLNKVTNKQQLLLNGRGSGLHSIEDLCSGIVV